MAMQVGGGGGKRPVPLMNVTPLVDVVLVLLIIFIVITPQLTKRFWIHTPKQEKKEIEPQDLTKDPNPPLVLRVAAGNTVTVNGADVPVEELSQRLRRMFAAREDHILFFDAEDEADFGFAVEVMDKAREGGAVTIATLIAALQSQPGADAPVPQPQ